MAALLLAPACGGNASSGVGGESHFVCGSDADCAVRGPNLTCVAGVCRSHGSRLFIVQRDGGIVDGSAGGASGATGAGGTAIENAPDGRSSTSDVSAGRGENGAGGTSGGTDAGAAGGAAAASGGTSSVLPDAGVGSTASGGATNSGGSSSGSCPDAGRSPHPSPVPDASAGCAGADLSNDPKNCGACGNVCGSGSLALASVGGNASAIAVDATSIYWVNYSAVFKMPLGGGAVTTLATNQSGANSIAVDATNVYWTTQNGGTVVKVALEGGSITVLASGQVEPQGIAVGASRLYWANYTGGTVNSVAVDGGGVTTIASNQDQPYAVAVDAANVYWTTRGSNTGVPTVMKRSIAGGPLTALARNDPGMSVTEYLAVDATNVYFTNTATVMAVPISGGSAAILASGQNSIGGVTVDSANVYWTSWNGQAVMTVSRAGGVPTVLSLAPAPAPLAVDGSSIYWLSQTSPTITTVMSLGGKTPFGAVRCEEGACVCPGNTTACFGLCGIDTAIDDKNCGGCGIECAPGTTCHCGVCE